MKKDDPIGARLKDLYEGPECGRKLLPMLPAIARLDGRNFSNFTKKANRPFDLDFRNLMVDTTEYLVKKSGAVIGYTQSDEITLAWYSSTTASEIFFAGKIQKMVSTLAAMASTYFNSIGTKRPSYGEKSSRFELPWHVLPTFDCRVFNVPTLTEAANVFVWRQLDATKNSVIQVARYYFSHNQLLNKTCNEMQEILFAEHNVNWNELDWWWKRGTFISKHEIVRAYTPDEVERLPFKHKARLNPNLQIKRIEYGKEDLWLTKYSNREDVLFNGMKPTFF